MNCSMGGGCMQGSMVVSRSQRFRVVADLFDLILDNPRLGAHFQLIVTRQLRYTISCMSQQAQGWVCPLNSAGKQLVSYSRLDLGTREDAEGS